MEHNLGLLNHQIVVRAMGHLGILARITVYTMYMVAIQHLDKELKVVSMEGLVTETALFAEIRRTKTFKTDFVLKGNNSSNFFGGLFFLGKVDITSLFVKILL